MTDREQAFRELIGILSGAPCGVSDWRELITFSGESLTIGSLAHQLLTAESKPQLSEDLRNFFEDIYIRARDRNRRLKGQFAELLPSLNAIGVEPIVMRGMVRLLDGEGEDARLLSDIDLLVPSGCRNQCITVLGMLGYRLHRDDDSDRLPTVIWRSSDVGMIDLHCSIQPYYLRIDYERLRTFCRPVRIGQATALLPDATTQIMLNIVHDQLHDGDYWRGLIDVRHLIEIRRLADEDVDWPRLSGFFPTEPLRRALAVQLRTVKSLLGGPIPESLCEGAWADFQLRRRRAQLRRPWLMRPLTLISLARDIPPRQPRTNGGAQAPHEVLADRLQRRLRHYFRAPNDGKMR